jgi:formylglycine-generating enzyme required for sulfatase activity
MAAEGVSKSDVVGSAVAVGEEAYAKFKGNRAGEEREFEIAPGVTMKFCWCPAGEFVMGSPKSEEGRDSRDEDQAKVTLTKGFWIAKTELTQAQWEAVMGNNPDLQKGADRPAVGVSWEDAQKFMEKINATLGNADGGKMSLPTEAQYEYAARAGEAGMYPGGSLDEVAWYAGNSQKTQPVGTKKPNAWGLHDMNGNAWEWVQDCYFPELTGGTDPLAPEWGLNRVIRGGCWLKEAADSRLATRSFRAQMASQCYSIGVRIVRNSVPVGVTKAAVIDPEIKGQNVTKITYQGSAIEQPFVQAGPKSWTTGEIAYAEVSRDEFSVYLQQVDAEDERAQIDLFYKKVFFRGKGPKVVHPILSASK